MHNDGKRKIINAARHIISEHGIQGATIRTIAEEAGLSTGAIYHYYGSKEAILYDVMDEGLSATQRIAALSLTGNKELEEIVIEIYTSLKERLQKTEENRLQFYLAHEAMVGNNEIQSKFKEKYNDWVSRLEDIFVSNFGAKPGRLTRATAAWIMAAIDGMMLQTLLQTEVTEIEDIMKIVEYLLRDGFPHFYQVLAEKEES
ncbi:TetR/AcrR family transcriptional regulator [Alkalihalobacillus sp. LMS39]|uniref:TetR/AcrR family transcriptional regulator n=1 Tax=Alkalihalobacillus sp. LMS39 TaxID=2924032 RepID=UPI001FB318E3|nr:TetR/AcrR family transcriptional regulator [Alkalihalobacillus sp. LMS39]UOE94533.1 TetR/AcrR family transcriptional regulator [Alkalihalobacillus sp. LMS39]